MTVFPQICLFIPEENGSILVSTTPLEKLYSINLIGFCDYGYTRTIAPFSLDLIIRANCQDAVQTQVYNQVFNSVEIHYLGPLIIKCNTPHFSHCFNFSRHRIE